MTPDLSIVIVAWNSWPHVRRGLERLAGIDFCAVETIIVDNGSTDGTVEELGRSHPDVRVHVNDRNRGHARGVNQGFAMARGTHLLLLDADTEVTPDAVRTLLEFLTSHPDVDVVAPRLFDLDGRIEESARNFPSVMSALFGRQTLLTRMFPRNPFCRRYLAREHLGCQEPFRVQQVSAACMLMRRSLIDEAGAWDEGYHSYWVDTDWCMRLARLGRRVFCVPAARIVHYGGNRPGLKKTPVRIWQFNMGASRLYRTHYTLGRADPRAVLATGMLAARAVLQIVYNALRPEQPSLPPPVAAGAAPTLAMGGREKGSNRADSQ